MTNQPDKDEEAAEKYAQSHFGSIAIKFHGQNEFQKHPVLLAFLAGCKHAKSQAVGSGWISVKERLPEKNEMVLVYFPNFPVHMRYGYWDNDEHLTFASLTNEKEGIATHWMPLPTPPQPEGEANEK